MNLAMSGGAFGMMSPMAAMPHMMGLSGSMYAGGTSQWVDMAPGSTNIPILSKLLSPFRRQAGRFERALRNNPAMRMKIQRFGGGYMPNMAMFSPFAGQAFGNMGLMNTAAMGMFGAGAMSMFGGNPFSGFLMGGLTNVSGPGWSNLDNTGVMGGRGMGSWNPYAMPGPH